MAIGIAGQKIITKGYGVGFKACEGIITTQFSLYCVKVKVKPPTGGGGPYPYPAWNRFEDAWDIYKPVNPEIYDPTRRFRIKHQVIITVNLNGRVNEKIFLVPYKKAKIIIKILNILNASKEKLNVKVKNIKKKIGGIKINIFNMKKRDNDS